MAEKEPVDDVGLERLVFFSDSVFAIAITLLALEIRLPAGTGEELSNAELWQSLLSIAPKYFAYILSFLVIGSLWLGHHRRYRLIQRYDNNLLLLNLLLMMVVAFIPFPTSLLSEYANQTSTIFYAFIMLLSGGLSIVNWLYASQNHRLLYPHVDAHSIRQVTRHMLMPPAVFLVSIAIAFISYDLARISWVVMALSQFIPDSGRKR